MIKIIGKFSEVDGDEFVTFDELRKAKDLIGSTSADVGNVQLYYDNNGTTYAVAHDSEAYYGVKGERPASSSNSKINMAISVLPNLIALGLLAYGVKKYRDAKKKRR